MSHVEKKIYRDWRDELALWSLYAFIALSVGAILVFVAPPVLRFFHKLDWKFFAKERYLYLRWIFQGLIVTLRISAISMVLALILGTLVAVGRMSHSRLLRVVCIPYVEFFRNTPLLIQLFFWYFGTSTLLDGLAALIGLGQGLLPVATLFLQGKVIAVKNAYNQGHSEIISGVMGLTVYTSAFIAETVRAGIQAIPHGQTEASRATGLSTLQTLWYVILPQAFRIILPPLLSQFLALTKNSAQAMAIGVAEVTYMARQVEANTFKGFEAFTVATGLYMIISFLMSWLLNRYDRSIAIAEMARKRQRLMSLREIRIGYSLGWLFVPLAVASGIVVFWRGGAAIVSGGWGTGLFLYVMGFAILAAALVALRRPAWGLGFIKAVLTVGAVTVFFFLLGILDRGLVTFDDPRRQLLIPLALGSIYGLVTAFWWLYFSSREILFRREDQP